MLTVTDAQLSQWLAEFFWPFLRVGAVVMSAPILNFRQVPARFKVLLAVMITVLVAPAVPAVPAGFALDAETLLIAAQQLTIGVVMGFMLQLVFSALIFGGQVMAYSMGLGFAFMMDPQNGVQVPVVSQYWQILAMLSFLLSNGHLTLLHALGESFTVLPVAIDGVSAAGACALVIWGGRMFAAGVAMALPVLVALLLVNIGMGVIGRAAPQLNIFAVGFPITLLTGFVLMWATLPQIMIGFSDFTNEAFDQIGRVLTLR